MDDALLNTLRQAVPQAKVDPAPAADMPTVFIDRDHVLDVFRALRDHDSLRFQFLADVTAVDCLPSEPRFEVVYHFARIPLHKTSGTTQASTREQVPAMAQQTSSLPPARLRVKVLVPGDDPRIASVTSLFPTAGWPEREVYDLMGITFDHHPDLRRILTPEDWTGHPLRKDYPVQIRKDAQSWSPVQLSVEEFAANVRATRERANRLSEAPPTRTGGD